MGSCYTQVKADLTEDKKVLFTGTPCQIAGLQTFLGDLSKNNNLVLCEIKNVFVILLMLAIM